MIRPVKETAYNSFTYKVTLKILQYFMEGFSSSLSGRLLMKCRSVASDIMGGSAAVSMARRVYGAVALCYVNTGGIKNEAVFGNSVILNFLKKRI